jgi:N-acetylglucosaminyldiphosphoundecaprenol N-acetyl-beta-D-mannosaminyltransferase
MGLVREIKPEKNEIAGKYPTVSLFGLQISKMDMHQTVAYLADCIEKKIMTQVITANPIMIMLALENQLFMNTMRQAELVVPDGEGIVWAAKFLKSPVSHRVAGYDLLHELLKLSQLKKWKVYLLGASEDVVYRAVQHIQMKYPTCEIVGFHHGYFSDDQDHIIIETIKKANPDILFVARSLDKQELWISKNKLHLQIPVMIGVGGSFDVLSGKLKRAPKFFRILKLEWFFRLLQEPKRYKRMFALPKFVYKIFKEKWKKA